jgi:hypothetical protein
MYLLEFDFTDPNTKIFFIVLGVILWCVILFNIIKSGVKAGTKDLRDDIARLINKDQSEEQS